MIVSAVWASMSRVTRVAMASSERIFLLLDTPPEIVAKPGALRPASVHGRVEFEDVSFAYSPGDWVLRDIAFAVDPGRSVALVGATGAGKTSIISLLQRFYDVQQGRVLLDGVDVRDWDPSALRRATSATSVGRRCSRTFPREIRVTSSRSSTSLAR